MDSENIILKSVVINKINNKCKYVFILLIKTLVLFLLMSLIELNYASHLNQSSLRTTNRDAHHFNSSSEQQTIISLKNSSKLTQKININHNNKTKEILSKQQNKDFIENDQFFNLILKDDSSSKYGNIKDQIDRHSYNFTTLTTQQPALNNLTTTTTTTTTTPTTTTTTTSPKNVQQLNNKTNSNESILELETSDSRFFPSRMSPRSSSSSSLSSNSEDEDDSNNQIEDDSSSNNNNNNYQPSDDVEVSVDGVASSNMNEQRVVKELTKILSKGMSGATDQVKLETLENLRRKQKERKVIKDNRAKLFEDLLTAAISSHPEKVLKKSKSSGGGGGGGGTNKGKKKLKQSSSDSYNNNQQQQQQQKTLSPSSLTGLVGDQSDYSIDPDTVVQQLQGLASLMEANGVGTGLYGSSQQQQQQIGSNDDISSNDQLSTSNNNSDETSSSSSSNNQDSELNSDNSNDNYKTKGKKSIASLAASVNGNGFDRPLVKQFKKIKRRISIRKKQLEQVKKMFDVDLAINPKDGSLMGKPANSNGAKKSNSNSNLNSINVQEIGDYTLIDDYSGNNKKHRTGTSSSNQKGNKMKELMAYLKENPEILASVMAELTTDSDPSRSSQPSLSAQPTSSMNTIDEELERDPDDLVDREGPTTAGLMSNYQLYNGNNRNHRHYHGRRNLFNNHNHNNNRFLDDNDPTSFNNNWDNHRSSLKSRSSSTSSSFNNGIYQSQPLRELQTDDFNLNNNNNQIPGMKKFKSSAENMLLESLRDRQLMNLARLEMVLAERQQQASNRSHTYTTLNGNSTGSIQSQPTTISNKYNNKQDLINISTQAKYSLNSNNIDPNHQRADLAPEHLESNNQQQIQNRQSHLSSSSSSSSNNHNNNYNYHNSNNTRGNNNNQEQSDDEVVHHFMSMNAKPNELPNMNKWLTNNSSSNSFNSNSNNNNININNKKQQTLGRFKEWRDVSQSEAASSYQRNDKTNSIPYDLTTGSSSSNLLAGSAIDGSFKANFNNNNQQNFQPDYPQLKSSLNNQNYSSTNLLAKPQFNMNTNTNNNNPNSNLNQLTATYQNFINPNQNNMNYQQRSYGDSIVTRPGPIAQVTPNFLNPFQNLNPFVGPSAFMTRSSIVNEKTILPPTQQLQSRRDQSDDFNDFNNTNIPTSNNITSSSSIALATGHVRKQQSNDNNENYDQDQDYDVNNIKSSQQKNSNIEFGNSNNGDSYDSFNNEQKEQQQQQQQGALVPQQRQTINYFKDYKNELQQSSLLDDSGDDKDSLISINRQNPFHNENSNLSSPKKRRHLSSANRFDDERKIEQNNHKSDVDVPDEDDGLGAMWAKSK